MVVIVCNRFKRSRRWNSLGWVAWRKICWIIPFGTIANVSLCFEYNLDYDFCVIGNRPHAIGRARLSETAKQDHIKMELIRCTPTIIYWMSVIFCITFILSERCILPKLGSPYAAKHIPLFSNLRPLLLSLVISQSVVHVSTTVYAIEGWSITETQKLTLYGTAYCLSFPVMILMSKTFRSHLFHILTNYVQSRPRIRKDSKFRKVTKHIARAVVYSKLEMENSEIDDRNFNIKPHNLRAILKEDAIYRIRFAMPHGVDVIEEEDESVERRRENTPIIENVEFLGKSFIEEEGNSGYSEHIL